MAGAPPPHRCAPPAALALVVSMGSPGDSPVRVHSSDKSPFLSLPGPSSRNATPQKDRDDGPRLVSPELLDDIIEGHGAERGAS